MDNIDELKQRAPDWSRQVQLTAYLVRNPNHKFTTILAVVQPDWFNDLTGDNWQDGIALKDAIEFESLDEDGSIGLLNLDNSTVYALDGQHRIMGIKGLADLEGNKFELKPQMNYLGRYNPRLNTSISGLIDWRFNSYDLIKG